MADSTAWYGTYPVSRDLHETLAIWQDRFERADLSDYGKIINFDWEVFHRDGIALARRLKAELGDLARVIYEKPAGDFLHKIEEWREVLPGDELLLLDPRVARIAQ